mmetsp:Transcript_4711/g.6205  ORF Transcript_4711/g.6205 Transcript_4711/m.6205 type:complete len:117 (-) Transcript_4711:149-499(-)
MLVLADFDNYFYSMRTPDHITRMITDDEYANIFTWETTTSFDAVAKIKENELASESILLAEEVHLRPKYIRMSLAQRNCLNKLFYAVYRFLALIYSSFYYYFMPWVASFFICFVLF